jgi:hypothetical protein
MPTPPDPLPKARHGTIRLTLRVMLVVALIVFAAVAGLQFAHERATSSCQATPPGSEGTARFEAESIEVEWSWRPLGWICIYQEGERQTREYIGPLG